MLRPGVPSPHPVVDDVPRPDPETAGYLARSDEVGNVHLPRGHATPYFFVCVDAGRAISRFPDGNAMTIDYREGDTWFDEVAQGDEIHDLENVGTSRLRFTTVELLA